MTFLEQIITRIVELPTALVYLTIGLLAALENVFPPVPADTAVALGAFLSGTGRISAWAVFGATWVGNVGSGIVVYLMARHLGRPFFRSRIGVRLLKPTALHRLEALYHKYGTWGIFGSRFIPALRALVPPFAGVAGVGAVKAIVPMAVASAIWYGTITYLAATFVREFDQIKELILHFNRVAAIVVIVLVGAIVTWWVLFHRKKRNDNSGG